MWVTPTVRHYVTSPFNPARRHPVTGIIMPHTGTDYRAPTGTILRAASDGVVVRSVRDGGVAGQYVRIDHGGGVWSGYSHLSRRDVVEGQRVAAGQRIGLAGDSGSATAAHLHFEVSVAGTKIDPHAWLATRVSIVSNPGDTGGGDVPDIPDVTTPDPLEEDDPMPTPADLWNHKIGPTPATSLPAWQQVVGAKNRATEAREVAKAAHERADTAASRSLRAQQLGSRAVAAIDALAELTGVSLAELHAKVDEALAAAAPVEPEPEPIPLPDEVTP